MKTINHLLFIGVCCLFCLSCSKTNDNPVAGDWELVGWTVGIPFHVDGVTASHTNFLELTTCAVNEVLTFDHNGIVTSTDTFSPKISIYMKAEAGGIYLVEEVCADGYISFSTSYNYDAQQNIEFNEATGSFEGRQLTVIYPNAVEIYNEMRTEIIAHKNLTLTYLKR